LRKDGVEKMTAEEGTYGPAPEKRGPHALAGRGESKIF